MDEMLCDELLQEIFTRIPSCSSPSIPLVSRRWLCLYRASKTSLSLRITVDRRQNTDSSAAALLRSFSSFLAHYPSLSSLSLLIDDPPLPPRSPAFNEHLLFLVSSLCFNLKQLKFLPCPVSVISLRSLSSSCPLLTSLNVSLSRPLVLSWVAWFSSLKELSVAVCDGDDDDGRRIGVCSEEGNDSELGLESVSFTGIGRDDSGLGFLWRRCKNLKRLSLKSCEGIGDGGSFTSFTNCLMNLQELELRTCRNIADGVLLRLAEHSVSLSSLLVYDGGSRDGLLHFITNSKCRLSSLDFRLPLDLNNDHLSAVATNFRRLKTLRLQSCCLVSGEGLRALSIATTTGLEELALINCDVVEREPGLLATLGQSLKRLRKLDLSYNEYLLDKEFVAMLASCCDLVDLKVRGCRGLTGLAMAAVSRSCRKLESVDIVHCSGIECGGVEVLVASSSSRLRRVRVEEGKVSSVARSCADRRFVEVAAA